MLARRRLLVTAPAVVAVLAVLLLPVVPAAAATGSPLAGGPPAGATVRAVAAPGPTDPGPTGLGPAAPGPADPGAGGPAREPLLPELDPPAPVAGVQRPAEGGRHLTPERPGDPEHVDPAPPGVDVRRSVPTVELRGALAARPATSGGSTPSGGSTTAGGSTTSGGNTTSGGYGPDGESYVPGLGPHVTPACTGTGTDGNRTHVLYAVEQGGVDRYAQVLPVLLDEVANVDDVVAATTRDQRGGLRVRWVTDATCRPLVTRVVLPVGSLRDDFRATISALAASGYQQPGRKYLVFAEARRLCGVAQVYQNSRPDPANPNNGANPMVARVDTGCWQTPTGGTSTPAHELMHVLGGVQRDAPHATTYGHCTDESDTLCYDDLSGMPMREVCRGAGDEARLDCGKDDYFSLSPPAGSYLASHWNTATSSFLTPAPVLAQPPSVTVTPSSASVLSGEEFTVTATGSGLLTYQWAGPEDCQTAVSYDMPTVTFRCPYATDGPVTLYARVTAPDGQYADGSTTVEVSLGAEPTVLLSTSPAAPVNGQPFTVTSTASGRAPFTYAWSVWDTDCLTSGTAGTVVTFQCPFGAERLLPVGVEVTSVTGQQVAAFTDPTSRAATVPGDVTAPQVVSFDVTPRTVYVASAPAEVTVTTRITDASGLRGVPYASLTSADGTSYAWYDALTRTSGSVLDGTWTHVFTVPQGSVAGTWVLTLDPLQDVVLNEGTSGPPAGFPSTVEVGGTAPATAPAAPTGLVGSPKDASALLSWTAPATGGSPITGYLVTASPGGRTCSTTGATSCTVTGLTNGTAYTLTVTASNAVGTGPASAPSPAVVPTNGPPGSRLVPLTPARVLDTRNGTGAPAAPVGRTPVAVQVTGRGGVPATGVTAVVLNLTAVLPTASTFVTAWPTGEARPLASNLNPAAGTITPNLVVVKVGAGGQISLYNETGTTDLVGDVAGYYAGATTGSTYAPLTPSRLLDTRVGTGAPAAPVGRTPVEVQVTGRGGVPVTGVTAVVLNMTAVLPTASSFVTAWPTGEARPLASNLNPAAGTITPNLVLVKVGPGGRISLYNDAGGAHLLADVAGYYTSAATGSGFQPLTPSRVLDSRNGTGAPAVPVGRTPVEVQIAGRGGVPATGVTAVVLNLTAVFPSASTFVTAFPAGEARPLASNLNPAAGSITPNLVVVKVGAGGRIALYNDVGLSHLVADVAGYYTS